MVPRQAGYFGRSFRAWRGVRQGDIMSPVIFNIMVDAVLRYTKQRLEGNRLGKKEYTIFYADDGCIAGTDSQHIQKVLNFLVEGFDLVGLKTNTVKTEFMIGTGPYGSVQLSSTAYNRKVTGIGLTHRQRSLEKVICQLCGTNVTRQYLKKHQGTKQCSHTGLSFQLTTPIKSRIIRETTVATPQEMPMAFNISIPSWNSQPIQCPRPGCNFSSYNIKPHITRTTMRRHFCTKHMADTIIIEEEGNFEKCIKCGFSGKSTNNAKHWATKTCIDMSRKRVSYFQKYDKRNALNTKFEINGKSINRVREFKYLGRVLHERDDDQFAASRQLQRARSKWNRIAGVLKTQGVGSKIMGYFYKAIVQAVLLYGSESWTLSKNKLREFSSFHNRVARYLCNDHIRPLEDGTYYVPSTEDVLEKAGLFTIEHYIRIRRATVSNFVKGREIYDECKAQSSMNNRTVWWNLI